MKQKEEVTVNEESVSKYYKIYITVKRTVTASQINKSYANSSQCFLM
jgi:hypothetical protein